jgi:hypothetical protein
MALSRSVGLTIIVLVLTVAGLVAHANAQTAASAGGLFSSKADRLMGSMSTSPDGRVLVTVRSLDDDPDGYPSVLRVHDGARQLNREFIFGLNAEVLWAPGSRQFAVTGSEGGANGSYQTAIVTITRTGLEWFDLTELIERAFGHPVNCGDEPESPNVGAITWISNTKVIVAAQIVNHSVCDSFGTFMAYQVNLVSKRVERRFMQLDAKKRWRSSLGDFLLNAPDECIRNPRSCYVSSNHQKLN